MLGSENLPRKHCLIGRIWKGRENLATQKSQIQLITNNENNIPTDFAPVYWKLFMYPFKIHIASH